MELLRLTLGDIEMAVGIITSSLLNEFDYELPVYPVLLLFMVCLE
jgi:hypothetical protein